MALAAQVPPVAPAAQFAANLSRFVAAWRRFGLRRENLAGLAIVALGATRLGDSLYVFRRDAMRSATSTPARRALLRVLLGRKADGRQIWGSAQDVDAFVANLSRLVAARRRFGLSSNELAGRAIVASGATRLGDSLSCFRNEAMRGAATSSPRNLFLPDPSFLVHPRRRGWARSAERHPLGADER